MDKISKILPPSPRTAQIDALARAKEASKAAAMTPVRMMKPVAVDAEAVEAQAEKKSSEKIQSPFEIAIQDKYTPSEETLGRSEDAQATFPTYTGELRKKKVIDDINKKFFLSPVKDVLEDTPSKLDVQA